MKTYLGIDWGGTYIKAGAVDSAGKILKKIVYSSDKLGEKKNFLNEIASLVKDLKPFNIQAV
ncbi:MAG: ROK family protein, partial [Candidatus Omnitrophica bacterium]|nr:ROK family protein [Candidatus Omnitrophota bacterium]